MDDKDIKTMLGFLLGAAVGTSKDKMLVGFLIGAAVGGAIGYALADNKEEISEAVNSFVDKVKSEYEKHFPGSNNETEESETI